MAESTRLLRSPGQPSNKHCNGQGNKDYLCHNKKPTTSHSPTDHLPSSVSSLNNTSLNKMHSEITDNNLSSASLIMKLVKERDQLVLQAVNLYLQSHSSQSTLCDLFSPTISTTNSSRDLSMSSPVPANDESMPQAGSVLPSPPTPQATSVSPPQTTATSSTTSCPSVNLSPSNQQQMLLPDSDTCSTLTSSSTAATPVTTVPIVTLTSDNVALNEDQVRLRIEALKVELEENDEAILAASMTPDHICQSCTHSNHTFNLAQNEQELQEVKSKVRKLTLENDEKNELISELREILEKNDKTLSKLQQENSELVQQTRRTKVLQDEIDILNEKVRLVDRLESEVLKYREKVNELDFYKTRLDEIREENKLLHDQKIVLQDQLDSARAKGDRIPELESQVLRLTALKTELQEQHSIDKEKLSCLMEELNSCRLEKKGVVDDLAQVQAELSHLRCLLNKNTSGINLREQLNSDATKRFLKLELEHQKLLSTVDSIRNSEVIATSSTASASTGTGTSANNSTNANANNSNDSKCTSTSSHSSVNGLMSNSVKAISPTASSCSSSASSYPFSSSSSACSNKRYSIDCTNGPLLNGKHYLCTNGSTVDSLDELEDADHLLNFTPETLFETDSGCVSLVGELNHRLEKIERENYQIRLSMDSLKESEAKLTKIRDENYSLQSQITTLKGQLELSKLKLDQSETNVSNLKDENQKLNKQITDLSGQVEQLRKDKNLLQNEKDKLCDSLKLTQDKLLQFSRSSLMRSSNGTISVAPRSDSICEKSIYDVVGATPPRNNAHHHGTSMINSSIANGSTNTSSNGGTGSSATGVAGLSSNFIRGTFKSSSVNFTRVTTRDNPVRMIQQQQGHLPQHLPSHLQHSQHPQHASHTSSLHHHLHHLYISSSITSSTSITTNSPCHSSSTIITGSNVLHGSHRSSNSSSNNADQHHHHHRGIVSSNGNGGTSGVTILNGVTCPGDTNSPSNHVHGHYHRVYHATHTTVGSSNASGNGSSSSATASSSSSSPSSSSSNLNSSLLRHHSNGHHHNGHNGQQSSPVILSTDKATALANGLNSISIGSSNGATSNGGTLAVQNATSCKNSISSGNSSNSSSVSSSPSSTSSSSSSSIHHHLIHHQQQQQQHPQVNTSASSIANGRHLQVMSPHSQQSKNHNLVQQQQLHLQQQQQQQQLHHSPSNTPSNHHHHHHSHHATRSVSPNTDSSVWFEYGCV